VHNTLLAFGPDFRENFTDTLPSGNVDVAPTVAKILGIELPHADGRPLLEALQAQHVGAEAYSVTPKVIAPFTAAAGLAIKSPVGADTGKSRYDFKLQIKQLRHGAALFTYFDWARAERN
jgi:arylsulfatase A-like enzyme